MADKANTFSPEDVMESITVLAEQNRQAREARKASPQSEALKKLRAARTALATADPNSEALTVIDEQISALVAEAPDVVDKSEVQTATRNLAALVQLGLIDETEARTVAEDLKVRGTGNSQTPDSQLVGRDVRIDFVFPDGSTDSITHGSTYSSLSNEITVRQRQLMLAMPDLKTARETTWAEMGFNNRQGARSAETAAAWKAAAAKIKDGQTGLVGEFEIPTDNGNLLVTITGL